MPRAPKDPTTPENPSVGFPKNIRLKNSRRKSFDGVVEEQDQYILTNRSDPEGRYKRLDLIMLNPMENSPIAAVEVSVSKIAGVEGISSKWRIIPRERYPAMHEHQVEFSKVYKKNMDAGPYAEPLALSDFFKTHHLENITMDIKVPLEQLMRDGLLSKKTFEKMDDAALELISVAHDTKILYKEPSAQKTLLGKVFKVLDRGMGAVKTA